MSSVAHICLTTARKKEGLGPFGNNSRGGESPYWVVVLSLVPTSGNQPHSQFVMLPLRKPSEGAGLPPLSFLFLLGDPGRKRIWVHSSKTEWPTGKIEFSTIYHQPQGIHRETRKDEENIIICREADWVEPIRQTGYVIIIPSTAYYFPAFNQSLWLGVRSMEGTGEPKINNKKEKGKSKSKWCACGHLTNYGLRYRGLPGTVSPQGERTNKK